MTNGRMLIENGSGENVLLYAWHDGHTDKALKMLLNLPFTVFEASKYEAEHEDVPVVIGSYFYRLFVEHNRDRPYTSYKDLARAWSAMIPLETCVIGIANWIVCTQFNLWHVVPSQKWMAYPGDPRITVRVNERRTMPGYTVSLAANDDPDHYHEVIETTVEELNKRLSQDGSKLVIKGKKQLTEDKTSWVLPEVYVPFDSIVVDLMYQALQKTPVEAT